MKSRTFRLEETDIELLKQLADDGGCSQSDVIRAAIQAEYRRNTQKSTENGIPKEVYEDLRHQLEIKDRQISDLSSALVAAQQCVTGAQALHGADVAAALAAPPQKKGFLYRLLGK